MDSIRGMPAIMATENSTPAALWKKFRAAPSPAMTATVPDAFQAPPPPAITTAAPWGFQAPPSPARSAAVPNGSQAPPSPASTEQTHSGERTDIDFGPPQEANTSTRNVLDTSIRRHRLALLAKSRSSRLENEMQLKKDIRKTKRERFTKIQYLWAIVEQNISVSDTDMKILENEIKTMTEEFERLQRVVPMLGEVSVAQLEKKKASAWEIEEQARQFDFASDMAEFLKCEYPKENGALKGVCGYLMVSFGDVGRGFLRVDDEFRRLYLDREKFKPIY